VTGGSSGIGYQTALQFAQYGAQVIITARDSHPDWFNGDDAAARINADSVVIQSEGKCRFVKTDMSNLDEVKSLFDDIRAHENDLHYAVNSAGITGPLGHLSVVSDYLNTTYDAIRNNLYGTLYSVIYETRFMTEKDHGGAIVNLASTNGIQATPDGSIYATSKFGIVGLTRSVGAALCSNGKDSCIRVNALAPKLTNTSLTWQQVKWMDNSSVQPWEGEYITPDSDLWKRYGPTWISQSISRGIAEPHHMADAILFLCSSDSSFITGTVFLVDRGDSA